MNKTLLHFISTSLVLVGLLGLYWVYQEKSRRAANSPLAFDSEQRIDLSTYKDQKASEFDRVSAIRRLCVKKSTEIRGWVLSKLGQESPLLIQVMIECLGSFPGSKVDEILGNLVLVDESRFFAIKALGRVENIKRQEIISALDISKWHERDLVEFHFSHFKTKSYFREKLKNLTWLVEFAERTNDQALEERVVLGLIKHVPNFKKVHSLLKKLIYKTQSEKVIRSSIIHLSVYDKAWIKSEEQRILKTKNLLLIKYYQSRAGVLAL